MKRLVRRLTRRYTYPARRNGQQQPTVWLPPHVAWPPPVDPWAASAETIVLPRQRTGSRR